MSAINTNMASEFWFFCQLHRLGYEAYITLGNTKAIDVVVVLKDGTKLSFDVRGKENFRLGTYQYLDKKSIKNHFYVFIGLEIQKSKSTKKIFIDKEPVCLIVESMDIPNIAHAWESKDKNAAGYGLDPKILMYLKDEKSSKVKINNLDIFKKQHGLDTIDLKKYDSIIMKLNDFETKYYGLK